MPKTNQTPASVLRAAIDEYQLTPFALSKAIHLSNSSVLQILKGKSKITLPTALRLSAFFGQSPAYWLDLQLQEDMNIVANDKKLIAVLKSITKVKKPTGKPASTGKAAKTKAKRAKKTTLADKRKTAAKIPGSRAAARKPKKK